MFSIDNKDDRQFCKKFTQSQYKKFLFKNMIFQRGPHLLSSDSSCQDHKIILCANRAVLVKRTAQKMPSIKKYKLRPHNDYFSKNSLSSPLSQKNSYSGSLFICPTYEKNLFKNEGLRSSLSKRIALRKVHYSP